MKIQPLFLIATVACLAAGCSTPMTKGAREGSTIATEGSYSVQPLYPYGEKLSTRKPPSTSPVPCPASSDCTINITVSGDDCEQINLDDYIALASTTQTVTWQLITSGYVFCPHTGDGAFLYDPNLPSNIVGPGNNGANCSTKYQWKRLRATGTDLEYYLRFRSATRICLKDPWARN